MKGRLLPRELGDISFLHAIGIPLAGSLREMEDVPARLIDDAGLLAQAKADAREWMEMEAERKGK